MDPREEASVERARERARQVPGDVPPADHPADLRTPETPGERERKIDPEPAKAVGKGAGGIAGAHVGAGLGAFVLGPIGMVIGAIAGAVGGWWAGDAIAKGLDKWSEEDDEVFRTSYLSSPGGRSGRAYEDVRPAYQLGYLAGRNPEYRGRAFDDIEADLRAGWSAELGQKHGEWDEVRPYVRDAYTRQAEARERERV
jgi:hypothetical protein